MQHGRLGRVLETASLFAVATFLSIGCNPAFYAVQQITSLEVYQPGTPNRQAVSTQPFGIIEGERATFDLGCEIFESSPQLSWFLEPPGAAALRQASAGRADRGIPVEVQTGEVFQDTAFTLICEGTVDGKRVRGEFPLVILNIPEGWRYETLVPDGCGLSSEIRVNELGQLAVAYSASTGKQFTQGLYVTFWDGQSWRTSAPFTIDQWFPLFFALDSAGGCYIPYKSFVPLNGVLKSLFWDGNDWQEEALFPGVVFGNPIITTAGAPGGLYAAYAIGTGQEIGFAERRDGNWQLDQIALLPRLANEELRYYCGDRLRLAANGRADGQPHLLLPVDLLTGSKTERLVLHFKRDDTGWHPELIPGLIRPASTKVTPLDPCFAVDPAENLHILFENELNQPCYGLWDGATLATELLPADHTSELCGIALDGRQRPHVLLHCGQSSQPDKLMHFYRNAGQWIGTEIYLLEGHCYESLAVAADGRVHVVTSRWTALKYVSFPCP